MASLSETTDRGARRLGRYEVLGEIASGGMGVVYLGRAHGAAGFERLVALKLCHRHLAQDARFVAMFLEEARLAARVHHPNVVATIDAASEPELYLVMEYVDGFSLAELDAAVHARNERVPVEYTLRLMADALAGLHAVHDARDGRGRPLGLVHRDVSPQNVLVGLDGVARIVDFGVAKAEARSVVTDEGQIKGKLAYMSPEQLRGESVSRWTDVYAAGVVLWELLAGRRMFPGTAMDLRARMDASPADPPSRHNPEVTPRLDSLVMRALGNRPEARYPTAAAFADALDACHDRAVPARELGAYVREALGERVDARHAIVTRLLSGTGAGLALATPEEGAARVLTEATASLEVDAVSKRDAPARRGRWLLGAAAGTLALVAATAGALRWHAGGEASRTVRAVSVVAPLPVVDASVAVIASAPEPSVATAPLSVAPVAPRPVRHRTHPVRAARPRPVHTGAHYDPPRI